MSHGTLGLLYGCWSGLPGWVAWEGVVVSGSCPAGFRGGVVRVVGAAGPEW